MTMKDETLSLVKSKVAQANPDCKVIVAPSLVGVYLNDSKDVLMRVALSNDWKFQHRGLLALVYHPVLNRLKLMVVDEKRGHLQWTETLGDYTNYERIHDVFHILNSSKNFCRKVGLFYEESNVARMVAETLQLLTALRQREQTRREVRHGKLLARSKSFNSTERTHVEVKLQRSYSNSMGDMKTHRTALNLFEQEEKRYASKTTTRRPSLRKMFNGLKSSFRVRIRRQDGGDTDNSESKRKRLSNCSTIEDRSTCRGRDLSDLVVVQPSDERMNDSLSANWKLTDRELQELYRLSFFKERTEQSTDLCTTEL